MLLDLVLLVPQLILVFYLTVIKYGPSKDIGDLNHILFWFALFNFITKFILRSGNLQDQPVRLFLDNSSLPDGVEAGPDGVWSIVGGKVKWFEFSSTEVKLHNLEMCATLVATLINVVLSFVLIV